MVVCIWGENICLRRPVIFQRLADSWINYELDCVISNKQQWMECILYSEMQLTCWICITSIILLALMEAVWGSKCHVFLFCWHLSALFFVCLFIYLLFIYLFCFVYLFLCGVFNESVRSPSNSILFLQFYNIAEYYNANYNNIVFI